MNDVLTQPRPIRLKGRSFLALALTPELPFEDWLARLKEGGVPAAPVADVADVVAAEQTQALGMLQAIPHPAIPDLRLAALPLSVDAQRAEHLRPPPLLGEHTAEVLHEAGYSDVEIDELARAGVVRRG